MTFVDFQVKRRETHSEAECFALEITSAVLLLPSVSSARSNGGRATLFADRPKFRTASLLLRSCAGLMGLAALMLTSLPKIRSPEFRSNDNFEGWSGRFGLFADILEKKDVLKAALPSWELAGSDFKLREKAGRLPSVLLVALTTVAAAGRRAGEQSIASAWSDPEL